MVQNIRSGNIGGQESAGRTLGLPVLSTFVASIALGTTQSVSAELLTGWTAAFDPMYRLVFGESTHVASVSRQSPQSRGEQHGDGYVEDGLPTGGEIRIITGRWGVGASAYSFNAQMSRAVEPDGFIIAGTIAGAENLDNSSRNGSNILTRDTNAEPRVWSANFFTTRTLAATANSRVDMLGGIKMGRVEDEQSDGHEEGPDAAATPSDGRALSSGSETSTLLGPLVGITGNARLNRHRFRGLFQQSVLFGEAEVGSPPQRNTADHPSSGSTSALPVSDDIGVPVTDLGVKYVYGMTENVSLGLGAFASVWWDVPSAHGIDTRASAIGATSLDDDTLVFVGGLGSVEVKF